MGKHVCSDVSANGQGDPSNVHTINHNNTAEPAAQPHHQRTTTYHASARWDAKDPTFALLNQETAKDTRVNMSVAVDLVIKGVRLAQIY